MASWFNRVKDAADWVTPKPIEHALADVGHFAGRNAPFLATQVLGGGVAAPLRMGAAAYQAANSLHLPGFNHQGVPQGPVDTSSLPPDIRRWADVNTQGKTYIKTLQKMGLSKDQATSYVNGTWIPQQLADETGAGGALSQSSIGGDLTQLAKMLSTQLGEGVSKWNKAYQGNVDVASQMANRVKGMLPEGYATLGPLLDQVIQSDRGVGNAMAAHAMASPFNESMSQLASRAFQQAYNNYLANQQSLITASSPSGATSLAQPF